MARAVAKNLEKGTQGRDLPFSGRCNRRGMEHGPEVFNGFSQGIGPATERPLNQAYLTPNAILDLKSPGLPFLQRSHDLESLEGRIGGL